MKAEAMLPTKHGRRNQRCKRVVYGRRNGIGGVLRIEEHPRSTGSGWKSR